MKPDNIKIIGFDADDTLWENEIYFKAMAEDFTAIMKKYAPSDLINQTLLNIEVNNLPHYGYGIKACVLSMLEASIKISERKVTTDELNSILGFAKKTIKKPVNKIQNVDTVLEKLSQKYKLILATKGDLLDQKRKLKLSDLEKYFHHIEIMTEKKKENYRHLLDRLEVKPENFLMVGNSVKSDILPVINIGASAIFVPFHVSWEYEETGNTDHKTDKFMEVKELKEILQYLL